MSKDKVFKQNPKLKKYFKTADGTKFYSEHHAAAHARSLKDRDVETVKRTFEAPVEKTADTPKNSASKSKSKTSKKDDDLTPMQKAQLRVDAIEALETVEAVEKALEGETAKTVKEAGAKRIEALKASNENVKTEENKNE